MTALPSTLTESYHSAMRACPRCNHIYRAAVNTQPDDVCRPCAAELAHVERTRLKLRQQSQGPSKWLTLAHDPSGDFIVGARFSLTDFMYSLLYGSWPIGMIFRRDDLTYVVVGKNAVKINGQLYRVPSLSNISLQVVKCQ